MIQLRLKFSNDGDYAKQIDVIPGELLSAAVERTLVDVPLGKFQPWEAFQTVVNGRYVEAAFWDIVALKEKDVVIISPVIKSGDAGQIFKQVAIIAITVVASTYLGPVAGAGVWGTIGSALEIAAVTIAATLAMNALIPPPVPKGADLSGPASVDSSQMYAISGQSNEIKRLATVPKVYGTHRFFPTIAAKPYTELGVSSGTYARVTLGSLTYTAKSVGHAGNDIIIKYQTGGTAGSETVSVATKTITITYENGVSTGTQIQAKVAANAAAAALVGVSVTGIDGAQTYSGQSNLVGGTNAGETVQYLYAIYDFGLGTPQVASLKIGDTPLTTDSFEDFHYNFVDPNRPDVPVDTFDNGLHQDFEYYRSSRQVTPLSVSLDDGDTNIQLSDANTDLNAQEILLDLICPRGLFGFSSGGTIGDRNIRLEISFALVGTTDWHAYNDLNYVDSFKAVGGADVTDFDLSLSPLGTAPVSMDLNSYFNVNEFYNVKLAVPGYSNYGYATTTDKVQAEAVFTLAVNQKKLLVPNNSRLLVGQKVFYGATFLGNIQSLAVYGSNAALTVITLDRNIPAYYSTFPAFKVGGSRQFPTTDWTWSTGAFDIKALRTSGHESGVLVVNGQSTNPVYSSVRFTPKVAGQYQVRVKRVSAYGTFNTQTGDAITWGAITTTYNVAPIVTDKRHVFMELKIRATNQLNGNISTLSGIVSQPLQVYDPDTGLWARALTSNPAWVFADLLTGEVNKKAIARSRLHVDSLVAWADFCDAIPDSPPDQTFGDPRFECNFVLDFTPALADILAQIGGSAQASLNIIDGKYGVLIDRQQNTPVQIFTPRNSKDFSSTRLYGPRPDGVKIKYIDPNLNWELTEIVAYDNGFNAGNASDTDELTAFACTSAEQAWRFGRYMIAQNRLRQETINITVDFEHLVCTRGDFVQITQDVMEVGGTPCRVKTVVGSTITIDDSLDILGGFSYGYTFRSSTGVFSTSTLTASSPSEFILAGTIPAVGDLIVIGVVGEIVFDCIVKSISPNDDQSAIVVLTEQSDAIYDYESSDVLPDYNPQLSVTSFPDIRPPNAVENLTVSANTWECAATQSGYNYYVELTWSMPNGSVFELFEVWVDDGRGYRLYDNTHSMLYKYNVEQARLDIPHGFKIVAVSASGKKLQLIAMATVIATPTTKADPPSDVSNFASQVTNQVIQLAWSPLSDCDVAQYVLRFSPETNDVWESSVPLAVLDKGATSLSVQARTGIYLIKAIDYAGNQSATAAAVITTIPNLFDLNIIEVVNEAPGFSGTKEQIELLGEAVILSEQTPGDVDTVVYYDTGYYTFLDLLDLGDIFSVRLQSLIRADGLRKGELMSEWTSLSSLDHLNTSLHSDWNVALEYRATDTFAAMSDWVHLSEIDHINYGAGAGFTDWRDIPSTGDATGRIFQFRIRMESLTANVTPRLFDATVSADMPDRTDSFENELSTASGGHTVSYDPVFKGPGTSPNVQISIDGGSTGDYWSFDSKTLDGFVIRIYDKNGVQVARQFDAAVKGFGHRHTGTI
jgi:hypothetical protein